MPTELALRLPGIRLRAFFLIKCTPCQIGKVLPAEKWVLSQNLIFEESWGLKGRSKN
jgi:hypothetical protein